jgi:dihydrofolate reductase
VKHHPLVEKILSLVTFDPMYENMGMPDPKVLYLSDEAKTTIKQEFEKYFASNDLMSAVASLLELACAFDKEGHNEIAISVLEIVVTANKALEKLKKNKNAN